MTDFPTMKGNARMARGASYFEVPLFSHVIDGLWQGCSPSEFPDIEEGEEGKFFYVSRDEEVECKWLMDESYDPETGDPGPPVPRFDKILNLFPWGKYKVPELTEMVEVEMFDSADMNGDLEALAELVYGWLEEGHTVLVHCQAGLNRSSLVVGYILINKFGMSADDAIKLIRDQRSQMCLCNDTFRQYLKGLS